MFLLVLVFSCVAGLYHQSAVKVEIKQGVPVCAIECTNPQSSAPTIERVDQDREHTTHTQDPRIALGHRILDCAVELWSS